FITLSSTVKEELKIFTNKPSVYFPHPINDNLGEPMDKHEARNHLNLEKQGRYILFFGIIRKYKGLDLLIKALGKKKTKEMAIKLLIAGEFYDKPATYQKLINNLDLEGHVIIVDKFIPGVHLKYYFSAADLVAQTYHTASQSGITQMAYHFERPMLVTNVGGLSEIVPHRKVGYVVERDPEAISEAIHDFFQNNRAGEFEPHIKEEKQKYTWEAFVDQLTELYRQL
ncbi:MAG: glycosyltransferase, partial [Bacteroidota bacterium]